MPKLTFITELNTVNFYKRIRTNKSSNVSHCTCVVEFWNQATKQKNIQYICLDINYAGIVSFFFVQKHSGFKRTILVPSRERGRMRHRIFHALFYRTCYAIIFEDSSWFWQCFLFFHSAYQAYYPPPPLPHKTKKTEIMSWQWHSPLKILRGVFKAAKTVWV